MIIGNYDSIEQISAHLNINALLCNYLNDVDERNFERIPSFFTADGVFRQYVSFEERNANRPVSVATGEAELLGQFHRFFKFLDRTHHSITNLVCAAEGDAADFEAHLRCYHRGTGPSNGLWEESLSMMVGKAERQHGKWLIKSSDYTVAIVLGYPQVFGASEISATA